MSKYRKYIITALAGIISGVFIAMGVHNCNRQPIETKVERDTVTVFDTIMHYLPKPVEVEKVKTEYRWLTMVEHFRDTTKMIDSVLVEVPIESRHYHGEEYDAYISGYEPSLDSIFVRQRTEYITETITRTVKDNKHLFVDVAGGCEYQFNTKTAVPFAELGARVKLGRVGIGAYGGYSHDTKENKASPYARIKVSYDILGF